jgi:phosphorylcholine metabolism protein LicD
LPNFKDKHNKEKTIWLAQEIIDMLTELQIPHSLCWGTLLGYYRENDLIEHDVDFDLAILSEDYNELFLKKARSLNGQISVCDCNEHMAKKFFEDKKLITNLSIKRDCSPVDIYFYHPLNETTRCIIQWESKGLYLFDRDLVENHKKVKFINREVLIPADTERWIVHMYGENWRTPVPTEKYGYNKNFVS